jgi:DNA repair exonuclease SbcCD ATPase subunit
MEKNKPSGTLPTELIDEKTFYTLGGASAGVLLVCWAINYIFVDVSWLNYKVYRLIGFIISEAFAVLILLQKKNKSFMKWVFAFLNGLLIFVNASGLNIMTSSYIFNPADTTKNNQSSFFHFQQCRAETNQQAGIFPLPRMISWWPDENLIAQNIKLAETNTKLRSENLQLKSFSSVTPGKNLPFTSLADSLNLLKSQNYNQQRQIRELEALLKNTGSELQQQLSTCIRERTVLSDSLRYYTQNFFSCQQSFRRLSEEYIQIQRAQADCDNQINLLTRKLEACMKEKAPIQETNNALNNRIAELTRRVNELENQAGVKETTLTELLKQICEQNSRIAPKSRPGTDYALSADSRLRQQDFYKSIDWVAFCRNFNNWNASKDVIIK